MAEVTGFTAARMLAMEDATVINAELAGASGYELILKTKDGTEINVGDVRGATGPVGPAVTALDDVGNVNAPTPANGDKLGYDLAAGEWVAAPKDYISTEQYNEVDDKVIIVNRLNNPDASLANGSGILQLGPSDDSNMVFDGNEIMVRDGSGGSEKFYVQPDGGDFQVGGPAAPPDLDLIVKFVSNANTTFSIVADADDVDESHTVTLHMEQDGGSVWGDLIIDETNTFRFVTPSKKGGPFLSWKESPLGLTASGISGVTLTDFVAYRAGNFGWLRAVINISNDINSPATGDVANTHVLTARNEMVGSGPSGQSLGHAGGGPLFSIYYNASSGHIYLTATVPNTNIGNRSISFSGFVLVDL